MPLIRSFAPPLAAATLALLTALPLSAERVGDYGAVVKYGTHALARDPSNAEIMQELLIARIGLGDIDPALPIARRLMELDPDNHIAGLVLLSGAIRAENWDLVVQTLEGGVSTGGLMDQMVLAWAHMGAGRMEQSLALLDELAEDPGPRPFALYHKAMVLALAGDFEAAAAILGAEEGALHLNLRGVVGYAQILSQLDRQAEALDLIDQTLSAPLPAEVTDLRARLKAGEAVPFDVLSNPREGIARVFFAVADTLADDADPGVVLLYSRVAEHLAPTLFEATILSAQLFEALKKYEMAVTAYGRISPGFYAYPEAALGRADALRRMERVDEAIGELHTLAKAYPQLASIQVALGDTLRYEDRFDEAAQAYDAAIGF